MVVKLVVVFVYIFMDMYVVIIKQLLLVGIYVYVDKLVVIDFQVV